MDILSFIAADDAGRSSSNVERTGNPAFNGPPVMGGPARVLSDGSFGNLPLGNFGAGIPVAPSIPANTSANGYRIIGSTPVGTKQALVVYSDITNGVYAVIVTGTDTKSPPVFGTALTVFTGGVASYSYGMPGNYMQALGSNRFLLTFYAASAIYTVVLTVSGTTVSAGTTVQIASSTAGGSYDVCKLNTTPNKFMITYVEKTTNFIKTVPITVATTTITAGSVYTISGTAQDGNTVLNCYVNTDSCAVIYKGSSTTPVMVILTVSGTAVSTMGSTVTLSAVGSGGSNMRLVPVNSTFVMLTGMSTTPSSISIMGVGISGTVGTYVSMGSITTISAYATATIIPLLIGATNYFSLICPIGNGGQNCAAIFSFAASTTTPNFTKKLFGAADALLLIGSSITSGVNTLSADSYNWSANYDASTGLISVASGCYLGTSGQYDARMAVLKWTAADPLNYQYDPSIIVAAPSSSAQNQSTANLITKDVLSGNYGFNNIVTLAPDMHLFLYPAGNGPWTLKALILAPQTYFNFTVKGDMVVGIAVAPDRVVMKGFSYNGSGLVAGVQYYYTSAGALTTVATGNTAIGKAISDSELVLKDFLF